MTWDEWLAWTPDSRITEWIDGEVIEQLPISEKYDAITRWLVVILQLLTRQRALGEIRLAATVLKRSSRARGREPDLMFISDANRSRIHATHIEEPVDAVFEIVSPESIARDRGDKFVEYEAEGIGEYWLIDPRASKSTSTSLATMPATTGQHPAMESLSPLPSLAFTCALPGSGATRSPTSSKSCAS